MYNYNIIQNIAIWAIPVLSAIIIHEVAHGYVAKLLGDRTAFWMGRLTLNPFYHIDLVGTIILPLICLYLNTFIFGWAKPVPINYNNLKNIKRDPALVALAGPAANLIMAILWAALTKSYTLLFNSDVYHQSGNFLVSMGSAGIYFNVFLMMLNLLPIPPLDGSKIINSLLPPKIARIYNSIENYGFIILIILMYTNTLAIILNQPLVFAVKLLCNIFKI